MQIKNPKILDIYRRYINFINAHYIYAVVTETTNIVSISYTGELARIIIKYDQKGDYLIVKITQDPTKKMSDTNGKKYFMSSIDEMNEIKAASKVIMDLKVQAAVEATILQEAMSGQGYLLDSERKQIGVVDLSLIPKNAFVYNTDIENHTQIKRETKEKTEEKKERSIARFFH